uniref:Uncharacterized protein n=1 Tax=Hanusia phi TaxID=3032 RepID=A0A7S0HUM4_9CRYP|mmetsp:Transcript_3776/g.9328  ORF Transcript_3776/g.9328 Transcript_3776/m.9328 type:complete len:298 (+) Transcript_3776:23-916(+)
MRFGVLTALMIVSSTMVENCQSFVLQNAFGALKQVANKHDTSKCFQCQRPRPVSLRADSIRMEGTMVTYFGKSKVLDDVQLFKFKFFQRKFDHLVAQGQAKEAVEVLIASESMIQISPLQAVKLLVDLFQSGLNFKKSGGEDPTLSKEDVTKTLIGQVGTLIRDHTLWHFALTSTSREMIERDIRYAERKLGQRWKSLEFRHDLLEIQPFFFYKLNISDIDIAEGPELDQSIKSLWEELSGEEGKVSSASLRQALSKDWQLVYDNESVLEDILKREAGESPAGFEAFRKLCLLVLQV